MKSDENTGRRRFLYSSALVATGAISGCVGSSPISTGGQSSGTTHSHPTGNESSDDAEPEATIEITDNSYEPPIVQVPAGSLVRWRNTGGAHTVTSYNPANDAPLRAPKRAGAWNSGELGAGETFEIKFDVDGVYDYFCRSHEGIGMVGSVIACVPAYEDQPGLSEPRDVPEPAATKLRELNNEARRRLGLELKEDSG